MEIFSPVPTLRATPVGAPLEVMMTMATSMADPISPACSTYQTTIATFSLNQKEFTDKNPSIHGVDNECFTSMTILCTISTSTFQATTANAIIDLLADDDDRTIDAIDSINFLTFLQEWEDFRNEFWQSTTHTLAHSSATELMPSPIVDDDDDDDWPMIDDGTDPPPQSSINDSLLQLRRSVWALEKVNQQFAQFLTSLDEHAPCQPTCPSDTSLQHQQPCPPPQLECIPQHVLPTVPPPAPDPQARHIPASLIAPVTDQNPPTVRGIMPRVNPPAPTNVSTALPPTSPNSKTTIPNWARPAVPPPAISSPMVGMLCMGKPNWTHHDRNKKPSRLRKKCRQNQQLKTKRTSSARPS